MGYIDLLKGRTSNRALHQGGMGLCIYKQEKGGEVGVEISLFGLGERPCCILQALNCLQATGAKVCKFVCCALGVLVCSLMSALVLARALSQFFQHGNLASRLRLQKRIRIIFVICAGTAWSRSEQGHAVAGSWIPLLAVEP